MNADKSFDVTEFLPYLLNQAAEQTSLEFQRHYRERFGMLRSEWRVLFHLGKFGSLTSNDIVQLARIHKTKISRAVHALEEKGFLRRDRDGQDRRRGYLQLTKMGLKVYDELVGQAETYEMMLCEQLGHRETALLKRALRVLAEQK